MERKVKTAVIGCGMISDIYIRNLKSLFHIIDLTALSNRHMEAAREKAAQFGIPRVMTAGEIAQDPEIELVVNLTPASSHYSVIRPLLEAGKHVYTEKSFTTTVDEARDLAGLAREKGLLIGVAPDTVLGAGLQTARRALDLGLIGSVTSGLVTVNRNQPLNAEVFRFLRGDGGSLLYDVGIYYIAALISLLGPVRAIRAFGNPAPVHEPEFLYCNADDEPWQIPGLNTVSASLRFASGAVVSLLADGNTVNCEQSQITLFGTRGILKAGDPNTFCGPVTLLYPDQAPCTLPFTHGYDGKNTLESAPFDHYGHRGIGVAEMAYALRRGRTNRLSADFGVHCMEILCGIEKAAESGETVTLSTDCEIAPLKPGYYSSFMGGSWRADAERSLMDI